MWGTCELLFNGYRLDVRGGERFSASIINVNDAVPEGCYVVEDGSASNAFYQKRQTCSGIEYALKPAFQKNVTPRFYIVRSKTKYTGILAEPAFIASGGLNGATLQVRYSAPSVAELRKALTNAIHDSPYSAIVQHTKVEVQRDGTDGDKQIRHARVLETLRGPKLDKLTYTVFTESGESSKAPKGSVIVTLCRDADGFYWPGVGSSFPNDKRAADVAKIAAKTVKQDQTVFPSCD